MLLRDLSKMNSINDGTRSLMESIAIPEVAQALRDWNRAANCNAVLIGGLAVSFYVRPRSTTDIDLLFISGADIPTEVDGFKRTQPGAFQHKVTHVEVEVVTPQHINVPVDIVQAVFANATVVDGIKVASPSGLVALKLFRLTFQDKQDIVNLLSATKIDLTSFPLPQEKLDQFQLLVDHVQ